MAGVFATKPRLTTDEYFSRPVKKRAPAVKRTEKGAWRFMADGSPSSDGIHADIAGAARLMFGPPGIRNSDGILWYGVEQRRSLSKGGNFLVQARGCIGGTPEFYLWWRMACFPGEVKRPESRAPVTGRKVKAEDFTDAQLAVHPEFAKEGGRPIVVWRSREEFVAWVREIGLPHRRVQF